MTSSELHLGLLLLLGAAGVGDGSGATAPPSAEALDGGEDAAGASRTRAMSALAAARNAVGQARTVAQREAALAHLKEADQHFAQARYAEAAQEADKAWELLTGGSQQSTRFTVEVERSGRTQVTAHSGQPLRVEAEGVTRSVHAGQVVRVEKGAPPGQPAFPPEAPALAAPLDGARLKATGETTSVTLTWRPVSGAQAYEVELVPEGKSGAETIILTVPKTEARLSLAEGRYRWAVRALGDSTRSGPSESKAFELVPAPEELKIQVKGTKWK